MNNLHHPSTRSSGSSARNLLSTALLGFGVFLIPVLLACLFVFAFDKLSPCPPPGGTPLASITNRLEDASVTSLPELLSLYQDCRAAGVATDVVNLRIWAAQANQPAVLFQVQPPHAAKRWSWHLSQDGRYAIAVSIDFDSLDRRQVGLFDLVTGEWLWKNALPWPDNHEAPYVFSRHVILRYVKNATRFAMELDPEGHIVSIDALGRSAFRLAHAVPANPAFPGTPVATKNGVFFATDPSHQALVGYALERLPGLRYAGKGDDNTLFSGNGLLKFTVRNGSITVADSLTQTALQEVAAWRHATNIVVTGVLTTHDGSGLNVFLKTDFGGTPAVAREWSLSLATYTGTVVPSFNADAQLARPHRARQRQTVSRDGQWVLSVNASNELTVAASTSKREVAKVSLGALLGLGRPIDHLAFLEEGRQVVLRQGDNVWLLDFAAACGYADLVARLKATAAGASPTNEVAASASATLPAVTNSPQTAELFAADEWMPETPAGSLLALRAEWLAAHQAWPYTALLLETCSELSAIDSRAPRVNPLLLARAQILSGHKDAARLTCRRALQELIVDPSSYNRMVRYHLQGLLFAAP